MPDLRDQIKEINYVRIALEVMSISGIVLGVCWAILVSKGNDIWASKEKTELEFKELSENIEDIKVGTISRKEIQSVYVTRDTQDLLSHQSKELKRDFQEFAKEQRSVNREILQRLPK